MGNQQAGQTPWQPRNLTPDCWIDVPVEAQHEMPGRVGIAWPIWYPSIKNGSYPQLSSLCEIPPPWVNKKFDVKTIENPWFPGYFLHKQTPLREGLLAYPQSRSSTSPKQRRRFSSHSAAKCFFWLVQPPNIVIYPLVNKHRPWK